MTEEELRKSSQAAPSQAPYAAPQPQYQQAPYAAPQPQYQQAPYAAPQPQYQQAPYQQAPYQQAAPTPVQPAYGYQVPPTTYPAAAPFTGRINYARSIVSLGLGIAALNFGLVVFIMTIALFSIYVEHGARYIHLSFTTSRYYSNGILEVYIMSIIFSVITLVMGIISICLCSSHRRKYPNNRMCNAGKGLSIASLILTGIALLVIIIIGADAAGR